MTRALDPVRPPFTSPLQIVVMGVSGAGKTTVARRLGERLGCEVADADDFHPPENVARMSAGIPLTDEDRGPWLQAVAAWIRTRDQAGRTAVVGCSALRRAHRAVLQAASPRAAFVHLTGAPALLAGRLAARRGHFMPPGLLASQLAILEPLGADEPGIAIDVAASPDELVAEILLGMGLAPGPDHPP